MEFLSTIMAWIGYVFAVIGFAATVYKSVQAWFSIRAFNWSEFDKCAKRLIREIAESGFHPDVIVTIGRGGAVVGAVLSGNLPDPDEKVRNIPLLGTDRLYEWGSGQRVEVPNEMVDFEPMREKRVLLVASDILSGGTMSFFKDQIEEFRPRQLKTACLVKGITSTLVPDYYGEEIPADFQMPWMYRGFGYARDSRRPT